MITRAIEPSDVTKLVDIHELYYKHEFEFPNGNFLNEFVVVDNDNNVISGGGVRTIAESVILTNKSLSPRIRREALLEVLRVSSLICKNHGYDQLHAFVKDPSWECALEKYGFSLCKNKAYYRNI